MSGKKKQENVNKAKEFEYKKMLLSTVNLLSMDHLKALNNLVLWLNRRALRISMGSGHYFEQNSFRRNGFSVFGLM